VCVCVCVYVHVCVCVCVVCVCTYIYIYINVCVCVCACVSRLIREKKSGKDAALKDPAAVRTHVQCVWYVREHINKRRRTIHLCPRTHTHTCTRTRTRTRTRTHTQYTNVPETDTRGDAGSALPRERTH
jgi:hypothetical protein